MKSFDQQMAALKTESHRIAKFYRFALHCHSPGSYDWARSPKCDAKLNDRSVFIKPGAEREFLDLIRGRCDCDVLAVTDHMKCGYAVRLAKALEGSGAEAVIPGMEVALKTEAALAGVKLHLIALLSPGCSEESFAKLLVPLAEEANRTGQEVLEGVPLQAFIDAVHSQGGLCIAAHVERQRGVRWSFRQTAKDVMQLQRFDPETQRTEEQALSHAIAELLFSVGFDAIEIAKPADRHHYRWSTSEGISRCIPTVLGLDAHCVEDYADASSVVLAKMPTPGFRGFANALKFPETRIRFPGDLKQQPAPRLVGLTISGSEGDSFFEDLSIAFSENLNTIIGARGSGKSTIVEALRYVFGYNRTIEELDQENKLSDRIKSLQHATLAGTVIRVFYLTGDNDLRILQAAFDDRQPYVTKVYQQDGTHVQIDDVEAHGGFPLRLYGWSEIETLGRDPARQRSLLDRMIPRLTGAQGNCEHLLGELAENRARISTLARTLTEISEENDGVIAHYSERKSEFERLNTPAVRNSFAAIDFATERKGVYDSVLRKVQALKRELAKLCTEDPVSAVGKRLEGNDALTEWWLQEQASEREMFDTLSAAQTCLATAKSNVAQFEEFVRLRIRSLDEEVSGYYDDLQALIGERADELRIAELRQNAKKRSDEASGVRDRYLATYAGLTGLLAERHGIVEELTIAREQVTGIRVHAIDAVRVKLNELTDETLRVGIAMVPAGDRREFAAALGAFLRGRGIRVPRLAPEIIAHNCTPPAFARILIEGSHDELIGKAKEVDGIKETLSASFVESIRDHKAWKAPQEGAGVETLIDGGGNLEAILKLEEVPWDDAVAILLNDQPVDRLSPGQRSSGMLPLIALAETCPLVIDQPEDNLDNRLVGNVLVKILADLKEQRQIIVCTHNPNIVVSGDAEQVVVLDAESDRKGTKVASGAIDNDDIVRNVVTLMEGGRAAFEMRRIRYGF